MEKPMSDSCRNESTDPDDSDQDQDYEPNLYEENQSSQSDAVSGETHDFRPRKRPRKIAEWSRTKAKTLRNTGKQYNGKRGELHEERSVKEYVHACRYKCSDNFSEDERKTIFQKYWGLASWDLQTAFINSCITKLIPKRHNANAQSKKTTSSCITLNGHRVCKEFFLRTLDISNKRFSNVLRKQNSDGIIETDKRGKHSPANKIPASQRDFVKNHIKSFPKFKSHYSRKDNNHRQYLDSSLNVTTMYQLYLEKCENEGEEPVKIHSYRKIFNSSFNLSFHKPYSDTCTTCDSFNNTIKNTNDEKARKEATIQKEIHLRKADAARSAKKDAKDLASQSPSRVAISFDLQKTLPTPLLTCSKVYYLRQLWVYNFAVHNLATGRAQMFMWPETEGSRGSQEIMSCLLKFIKDLPTTVTHIDAFSDNCGGQNKNKNIVQFWSYVVCNTTVASVDHRFLVSGHSFMECDQDFAVIEKVKRKCSNVFVPDDWCSVVSKASRKFKVNKMTLTDFKSIQSMKTHMKDSITGIRKMQWMHFEKSNPFSLFYKDTLNEDMPFERLDLKKGPGRPSNTELTTLYDAPLKIASAKYRNLIELLPFIPPVHHSFYTSLPHEIEGRKRRQNPTVEDTREQENINEEVEEDSDINDMLHSDYDE